MAAHLLRISIQSLKFPNLYNSFPVSRTPHYPHFPSSRNNEQQLQPSLSSFFPWKPPRASQIFCSSLNSTLSTYTPPKSKEEAILQAKTSLSNTLEKPLNNPRLTGKFKKQKQPRFQVEIPVIDDSPDSLTQLALQFFENLHLKRKDNKQLKILLLWPSQSLTNAANVAFSNSLSVENLTMSSLFTDSDSTATGILNSGDVAVFLAPDDSMLEDVKTVSDSFAPKPVVLFNPKWGFDEEKFGELSGFAGSFEVVYSFMGLEVRGILSKRKGVVFKSVRDGVLGGDKRWEIYVEEEAGEVRVISRFKKRPSIGEVENVLYNLMAVNSPITKSAKFLRDLVSNVTGNK